MCAGWQLGSLWQGSKAKWLGELSDKCAAVIYHWDKELYTVMPVDCETSCETETSGVSCIKRQRYNIMPQLRLDHHLLA